MSKTKNEIKKAKITISTREFAKAVGVTQRTVLEAIERGRLKECIVSDRKGQRKAYQLDPVIGEKEWKANCDEYQIKKEPQELKGPTLTGLRTVHEGYKAQLAQLDLEEKKGNLVQVSDVKMQAYEMGRLVRDSILSVPPRIAAELKVMKSEREIINLLNVELGKALAVLQRGSSKE